MKQVNGQALADVQWWEKGIRNRHEIVTALLREIQNRSSYRRQLNLHHLRLYADRAVTGLAASTTYTHFMQELGGFNRPRLSINVVRNCIDAATSMITRGRPAVAYMTTGGDFELQQRSKARGKFVEAIFHQNGAYDLGQRAFKDCGIFGTGLIKVCRRGGKVVFEKTFPGEIWVDDQESLYGDPPSMFQVRAVDRLRLKAMFPKADRASIEDASGPDIKSYGRTSIANQAQVVEAWHLPSSPDSKDGRHVICTDTGTLLDEPYKHEAFPFAVMRWNDDPLGWWGSGLAYELSGIQFEINSLVRHLQQGVYSAGGMKILIEKGSRIVKNTINNDTWATMVEYTGQPPQFVAPQPVAPVVIQLLEMYIDQAYAITGISQLGARGEIPAGLAGSGRAQLVYKDIESQRFITTQRRYEQFFMDLAERTLEAASDMYETDGAFEATYVGDKFLERIDFDDIQGDKDEFVIHAEPVSMLPYTMAGKFALAEQMRGAGYIDTAAAKKLSGLPDVDAEMNLELAPIDLVDQQIECILNKGESLWPDPRGDVALSVKRATLAFQRASLNGAPPDRLDLLAEYIDAGHDMIQTATDAATAQAAAAAPAPTIGAAAPAGQFGLAAAAPPTIPAMEAA